MTNGPTGQPPSAFHLLAGAAFAVVIVAGEAWPTVDLPALRITGVLLLLTSTGFWIPPFVLLSRHGAPEPGKGFTHTTRVVRTGLYGVVRHPQYLGYSLLVAGFVLIGFNPTSVAAGSIAVVAFYLASRAEERFLLDHMGEDYVRYMCEVPRFDPIRGSFRRWMGDGCGGNKGS